MITKPEDFKHKAREWAVKYAGAPRQDATEGSGGATAASLAEKAKKRKEEAERQSMAQLVKPPLYYVALRFLLLMLIIDIMVTTKIS